MWSENKIKKRIKHLEMLKNMCCIDNNYFDNKMDELKLILDDEKTSDEEI